MKTEDTACAYVAGEARQFFEHAFDFMEREVGRQNIVSAVVHMDERTPYEQLSSEALNRRFDKIIKKQRKPVHEKSFDDAR